MRAGRDSPQFRSALGGSRRFAALAALGLALGVSSRAADSLASRPLFFLNSGLMVFAAGAVIAGSASRSTRLAILNGALFLLAAVAGYYLVFRFGPGYSNGFWPPVGIVLTWVVLAAPGGAALGWVGSLARSSKPWIADAATLLPVALLLAESLVFAREYPMSAAIEAVLATALFAGLAWRCNRSTHRLVATLAILVVGSGGFTLVFVAALRAAY